MLPTFVLRAISSSPAGKITIIVGAGCSYEAPTSLPLARECSIEAHRRLVADGVLTEGECENPKDLSILTDAVVRKCGDQRELVARLPSPEFGSATPNEGHLIAAALQIEGAVSNIVTLNFDLALTHALSLMGARGDVSILNGPEQHQNLSATNLIYLHRNINADPNALVLTTKDLDQGWEGEWQEVIAAFTMAAPLVLFAGLGSSCAVLTRTAIQIGNALQSKDQLVAISPSNPSQSKFAQELEIASENCIALGWIDFMRELGGRFHQETVARIESKCQELIFECDWPETDVATHSHRLQELGLLEFGELNARLSIKVAQYLKNSESHFSCIADLLLAIRVIEHNAEVTGRIHKDGTVCFDRGDGESKTVRLIAGGPDALRWGKVEAELKKQSRRINTDSPARCVLASGVVGDKPGNLVLPQSILEGDEVIGDIIDPSEEVSYFGVEEIRCAPELSRSLAIG